MNLIKAAKASFILIALSFPAQSQKDFNNYTTLLSKGKIPDDFTKQTYTKLEEDLKKDREELRNSQEKVFVEGTNYAIDEILHSGLVVFGDDVSTYVGEIASKLLQNDYALRSKLRFYTIKSNTANAFSTDQGILFVTTGLIAQLTSEAQLAYVLAHEIAHYKEKHVVETFDWSLKNRRYGDNINRLANHSKEQEFEADKLGIKMYYDAGYSSSDIFSTFDVLMYSYLPFDEIEFPFTYFNSTQIYIPQSLFPDKKYPIKAEEDYDDENSSHPNIKKRKEAAEKEIGALSNWGEATQYLGNTRFNTIRNIARFESVRSDILDASYADAMYSIFLLEREFPTSIYLKRMKAQVWLNLMLFKKENVSSKTIDRTADLEGESAALHFFLKKLNKEGMSTLALRQVYDLHKAYPEDKEISAVYDKLINDLTSFDKFKTELYSKKTFQEAAQDYVNAKKDTSKAAVTDTTTKKGSKYDRIKNKKNADLPDNFDSTKFYLYGITDILIDPTFQEIYESNKKKLSDKEKDDAAYEALTPKEKKVHNKKEDAEQYSMGINEVIVVEPMVVSYRRGNVDNVKSEKLEAIFSDAIENSAQMARVTTYPIDSRSLINKGADGFNERSTLISLLNQLAEEEDVNMFPVDFQLLNSIQENYGTSKVMFSLVEHEYAPDINFGTLYSSIIFPPIFLIYFPNAILTGNNTEINVLILDMEAGKIENGMSYYFKDSPKRIQLGAHMYDIFKKLSTTPTN
ncbi:MAG: M48 family metallopeptidase [Flavobacteriia bacterium]